MPTLEIRLAKFEVIPTNRSRVSFSESIRMNYYFLASGVTSIGDIVSQRTDVIHAETKYSLQNVLSNVLANMDDGGKFIQP